jgi:hypothetical protein
MKIFKWVPSTVYEVVRLCCLLIGFYSQLNGIFSLLYAQPNGQSSNGAVSDGNEGAMNGNGLSNNSNGSNKENVNDKEKSSVLVSHTNSSCSSSLPAGCEDSATGFSENSQDDSNSALPPPSSAPNGSSSSVLNGENSSDAQFPDTEASKKSK